MHKGKVTIKDIARELGISPSTVSKALKGHPDISSATKKAVRNLVEKYNYKPDAIALSLQSGFSKTIGVIVPEIVHYFFSTVISGIEDLAYDAGYQVMFCQSNESYEREVNAVDTLLSNRVDGILVSITKETEKFDHLKKIQKTGIPIVFFDRICDEVESDRVVVDDEEGAYKAVNHLINIGCRNIVHLSGPPNLMIGKYRKEGYIRALKEHNFPVTDRNIVRCDTAEEARLIIPGFLSGADIPDGFFAVNDLTAAETMKIVKQYGYQVPKDIAIVGYTSGQIASLTDPPLSSVDQHGYIMGKEAVKLLVERIEKGFVSPFQTKVIKTELVISGSSLRQ